MKQWLFILLIMAGNNAFAQTAMYDIAKDHDNSLIYKGPFTFEDLDKEGSFTWYDAGIKDYHSNADAIAYLKQNLPDYDVTIIMGTWCEDSRAMIPKLYRVLQEANYPMTRYTLYGVDRDKKGKGNEVDGYHATLVPTIILSRDGKEAGRIVESTKTSVETDLMNIIKGEHK